MTKNENVRELIVDMLLEITTKKEFSHIVIRNVLQKYNYLNSYDKNFIKRVCEGTIERQIQLDFILNSFSSVKVSKMKPFIRCLLRMSVYQMLFMNSVPNSAACNEAVKIAQKRGFAGLKGFVNGLLRTIAREKENINYPCVEENPIQGYSIRYSMPEWIIKRWMTEYGTDVMVVMLEAMMTEHPVTIRMDEHKSIQEVQQWKEQVEEKGIVATVHPYLSYAYDLTKTEGLYQVPGFEEGMVNVQDVSSMLAVEIAAIPKESNVLDICAAPGGKTLHMACKLNATGTLEARDISEKKIQLINDNIARNQNVASYKNIVTRIWDATVLREEDRQKKDIVFVDAPCSGLGVIGKKPDIKYIATQQSLTQLSELQKSILATASEYVKLGGTLIYSTCTINKEENENNVAWFLQHFPFEAVSIEQQLPDLLKGQTGCSGYLQLLPGVHKTDGFFIAKFQKKKS